MSTGTHSELLQLIKEVQTTINSNKLNEELLHRAETFVEKEEEIFNIATRTCELITSHYIEGRGEILFGNITLEL